MEKTVPIQIKANRDGFTLVPDPAASFEEILSYVLERLDQSKDFFNQKGMVLDLRARPLGTDEVSALHELLFEKSQVKLVEVKLTETVSFFGDGESIPKAEARQAEAAPAPAEEWDRDAPVIVKNTCRSGARIVSPSDCVILGDVNPGAEIIAEGDIIVFGALRGVAHAGAAGDATARIWALSIEPSQIRIANYVAVPPRDMARAPVSRRFEVAEIQNNAIEVVSS